MRATLELLVLTLLTLLTVGSAGAADLAPEDRITPAEAVDFEATPGYEQTLDYIRRLAAVWPALDLQFYGTSAQGRPMPVVVVSTDRAFTPEAAAATGKAIVLVQNGIHSGEIDGKDACLMILRDLVLGRHREILDGVILVVVPIYNVDGHERVSPYNRANQNGPRQGMGFRTTADGHDLNRDHVKLDTPEARAMIGLFNRWQPQLHVDDHVTDGSDHAWVLTYSWAEAPQLADPLDAWMRAHMPAVLAATEAAGHRIGPYVSLIDRDDPTRGFSSFVGPPRLSTGYYALRNVPSILVENHSYREYRDRVLANRDFLLALFQEVARAPKALRDAVSAARERTVALGRPDAAPSDLILAYRVADPTEKVRLPFREWYSEESIVSGAPLLHYREGTLRETEVPWKHRPEPTLRVARPRGYLVLPGWPSIEPKLTQHGLRFERLSSPAEVEVETLRISNPRQGRRSSPSYQGRTTISVDVERSRERTTVPAGTLWVPADQPDFEVAAQLFEPDAPDSLVSWGMLSLVLERKEYIEPRVLEGLVREMLEADAGVAAEWERAQQDEAFAADGGARYMWWYRRTPYWDDTVGLMPVLRALEVPGSADSGAPANVSVESGP